VRVTEAVGMPLVVSAVHSMHTFVRTRSFMINSSCSYHHCVCVCVCACCLVQQGDVGLLTLAHKGLKRGSQRSSSTHMHTHTQRNSGTNTTARPPLREHVVEHSTQTDTHTHTSVRRHVGDEQHISRHVSDLERCATDGSHGCVEKGAQFGAHCGSACLTCASVVD
jgi:hypothetical protein